MREEIKLFISKMNMATSLDEVQKVCKTEQELYFVLSRLVRLEENNKAVLLPLYLRKRASLLFQDVAIEEITVQAIQRKFLIGYPTALALKNWLKKEKNAKV